MKRTNPCPMADLAYWAALLARYARTQLDIVEPFVRELLEKIVMLLETLVQAKQPEETSRALKALEEIALGSFADGAAPTNGESQPCPYSARLILFLGLSLKKWRKAVPGVDPQMRRRDAILGFVSRNAQALLPPDTSRIGERWIQTFLYPRMSKILKRWLPDISSGYWVSGRFGPGACMEKHTRCRRFVLLTELLDQTGAEDCDVLWRDGHSTGGRHVRLCAVPKAWDKDRLITVEPWVGGYLQQGVRSLILESIHRGPLAGSAMDQGYEDGQRIQRQLATVASKRNDSLDAPALATIDLKDASDNITIRDVVAVFPGWVVQLLEGCRTPYLRITGERALEPALGGTEAPLGIYAGMGNATTFIIETLFFAAFVEAIAQSDTNLKRTAKRLSHGSYASVYGDDIICDTKILDAIAPLGTLRPFVVNRSKTFGSGLLRESCGIYAFNGVDVSFPRIHGYSSTWSDRVALAAKLRQLLDDAQFYPIGLEVLSTLSTAGDGMVSKYENDCYPSVAIDYLERVGALPAHDGSRVYVNLPITGRAVQLPVRTQHLRRNRETQQLEVRERILEQRVRRFSHVQPTDGVSPRVWLDKWFTGEQSEASLGGAPAESFPVGRTRWVNRWLLVERPTRCSCASADFSLTVRGTRR